MLKVKSHLLLLPLAVSALALRRLLVPTVRAPLPEAVALRHDAAAGAAEVDGGAQHLAELGLYRVHRGAVHVPAALAAVEQLQSRCQRPGCNARKESVRTRTPCEGLPGQLMRLRSG